MTYQLIVASSRSIPLSAAFGIAAVAGLLVGSFLNVVVYRVPRGLSVSKPRSFCPTCDRQLSWWENVPLVSWVALRGRCRTCHQTISIRYPLVEGGTAVVFVLITWARHGSLMTIPYCLLAATIISILLIETSELRSPLLVAALGTAVGDIALVAVSAIGRHWSALPGAQVGLLVGIVVFSALRRADPECRRPENFGRGALIPVGCWLGGLGLVAGGIGAAVLVAGYLVGVLGNRSLGGAANPEVAKVTALRHVFGLPMILATALATTAALIAYAQ
ncbi:MAG TPA: prepilin peptidase [Acidimicrobiales bacterium]|nr:prepilin peptidase [Acidimicrobiales bacterium]